jgi:hypothetical protein
VFGVVHQGRLPAPPAEVNWRTRLDTRFTRMFGLPIFSAALRHNSAFIVRQIQFLPGVDFIRRPDSGNRLVRENGFGLRRAFW